MRAFLQKNYKAIAFAILSVVIAAMLVVTGVFALSDINDRSSGVYAAEGNPELNSRVGQIYELTRDKSGSSSSNPNFNQITNEAVRTTTRYTDGAYPTGTSLNRVSSGANRGVYQLGSTGVSTDTAKASSYTILRENWGNLMVAAPYAWNTLTKNDAGAVTGVSGGYVNNGQYLEIQLMQDFYATDWVASNVPEGAPTTTQDYGTSFFGSHWPDHAMSSGNYNNDYLAPGATYQGYVVTGFAHGRLSIPAGKHVVIDLNGHTIDRKLSEDSTFMMNQVFLVETGAILEIYDSKATDSNVESWGRITGGNYKYNVAPSSPAPSDNAKGGAVHLAPNAQFYLHSGIIENNSARFGGAIYGLADTHMVINGGIIRNNTSQRGGACYLASGTGAVLSMYGGEMYGNSATSKNSSGADKSVAVGSADAAGGGVQAFQFTSLRLYGGSIKNNTAYRGGGVYIANNCFLTLKGGLITGNTAVDSSQNGNAAGGGVYISNAVNEVVLSGPIQITKNYCTNIIATPVRDITKEENLYLEQKADGTNITVRAEAGCKLVEGDTHAIVGLTIGDPRDGWNNTGDSIVQISGETLAGYDVNDLFYSDKFDRPLVLDNGVLRVPEEGEYEYAEFNWQFDTTGNGNWENISNVENWGKTVNYDNVDYAKRVRVAWYRPSDTYTYYFTVDGTTRSGDASYSAASILTARYANQTLSGGVAINIGSYEFVLRYTESNLFNSYQPKTPYTLKTLKIDPKPITSADIVIPSQTLYYNGKEHKPVTVTSKLINNTDLVTLTEGKDYTIAYAKNVNAGTATATITGKGSYSTPAGGVSVNFTISPRPVSVDWSSATVEYVYGGPDQTYSEPIAQSPTFKLIDEAKDGTAMPNDWSGTNVTVKVDTEKDPNGELVNNLAVHAGKYIATAQLTSNYCWANGVTNEDIEQEFTINPRTVTVVVHNRSEVYGSSASTLQLHDDILGANPDWEYGSGYRFIGNDHSYVHLKSLATATRPWAVPDDYEIVLAFSQQLAVGDVGYVGEADNVARARRAANYDVKVQSKDSAGTVSDSAPTYEIVPANFIFNDSEVTEDITNPLISLAFTPNGEYNFSIYNYLEFEGDVKNDPKQNFPNVDPTSLQISYGTLNYYLSLEDYSSGIPTATPSFSTDSDNFGAFIVHDAGVYEFTVTVSAPYHNTRSITFVISIDADTIVVTLSSDSDVYLQKVYGEAITEEWLTAELFGSDKYVTSVTGLVGEQYSDLEQAIAYLKEHAIVSVVGGLRSTSGYLRVGAYTLSISLDAEVAGSRLITFYVDGDDTATDKLVITKKSLGVQWGTHTEVEDSYDGLVYNGHEITLSEFAPKPVGLSISSLDLPDEVLFSYHILKADGTTFSGIPTAAGVYLLKIYAIYGDDADNYELIQDTLKLTIQKADLKIIVKDVTAVYGDKIPNIYDYYTVEGLMSVDESKLLSFFTLEIKAVQGDNVGKYPIIGRAAEGLVNYVITFEYETPTTFTGYGEDKYGVFEITTRKMVVTVENIFVAYGEALPDIYDYYTVEGFYSEDGDVLDYFTLEYQADADYGVNSYYIFGRATALATNYEITFQLGSLNVTPRQIVVTINDIEVVYGDDMPDINGADKDKYYTITAPEGVSYASDLILSGDDVTITVTLGALKGYNVGVYPISGTAIDNTGNYIITVRQGSLTITARKVTVSVGDSLGNVYGEALGTIEVDVNNIYSDDVYSDIVKLEIYDLNNDLVVDGEGNPAGLEWLIGQPVGTYKVRAVDVLNGNYNIVGNISYNQADYAIYEIVARSLKDDFDNGYISVGAIQSVIYNGTAWKPALDASAFNVSELLHYVLVTADDYTLGYEDNINAGTAWIVVKAQGNFKNEEVRIPFTILPKELTYSEDTKVEITGQDFVYNGSEHRPEPEVSVQLLSDAAFTKLLLNSDFVVSYENNIKAGTAKVIVSGRGNYSGEVIVTFVITQKDYADGNGVQVTIEGWVYGESGAEPEITNMPLDDAGDIVLTWSGMMNGGREYAESDIKPTEAGEYILKVRITWNNYSPFETEIAFTIARAEAAINTDGVELYYIYTGALQTINSGATLNHAETYLTYANNTFTTVSEGNGLTVLISAAQTNNYESAQKMIEIFVFKASNAWITEYSRDGWKEGEAASAITEPQARFGEATIKYFTDAARTKVYEGDFSEAGTYYVEVSVAGTDDYDGILASVYSFTVTEVVPEAIPTELGVAFVLFGVQAILLLAIAIAFARRKKS